MEYKHKQWMIGFTIGVLACLIGWRLGLLLYSK